jgi:Zn-finger nucleic acid-binding protein
MKLYKGKKINEEEEFKIRYDRLEELTNDFEICPFCQIKLKTSKPKNSEESDKLVKNLYCPRCYRVFGHLEGKMEQIDADDEEWEKKKVPFDDAKQILHDLQDILKDEESED